MASWGRPMSTVFTGTWEAEMFPRVEPPAMSDRFRKVWKGTCARRQMVLKTAADTASVVYLVYRRAVHCIRLLRLIGVHCVGIVSGQHEAGGQHGEIVLS